MSWDIRYLEWKYANLNEILAFLLAALSLAVAYIPFASPILILINPLRFVIIPYAVALLAIIPHEIGHRQAARRYGCFSRFTLSFVGFWTTLILNLIGSFIGILVFFAGYTSISCGFRFNRDIEGRTALAGPLTNIVLGFIGLIGESIIHYGLALAFFSDLARFNFWVAFFNLLPFWVLDGLKIFRWNMIIWSILIVLAFALVFL
ncbi:site-2 protease family protein [Sulfolobus tengchongensis]|uniref:Site-2 protease family protein n=1 Tax=Sulfolobus tengchongensis TaxID=207809 RepID=A0AAX4L2D1_9CREN